MFLLIFFHFFLNLPHGRHGDFFFPKCMSLILWPRCGNISDGFWLLLDCLMGSSKTLNGPVSASPASSRVLLSRCASSVSAVADFRPVPPDAVPPPATRSRPLLPLLCFAAFPPSVPLTRPVRTYSLFFQGNLFRFCDCVSPSVGISDCRHSSHLTFLLDIPLVNVFPILFLIIGIMFAFACFCILL